MNLLPSCAVVFWIGAFLFAVGLGMWLISGLLGSLLLASGAVMSVLALLRGEDNLRRARGPYNE